jgi:Metal-dependent hydrolases of the beta-lactamase superfamily III
MKLTVLGNYGTFPGKDGACSGFLLQDEGFNILIDAGNGVMGRLQRYVKIDDLSAIILSHLHWDHSSDMQVLKYAVETKLSLKTMEKPIDVYLPSSPQDTYNSLTYRNVFSLKTVDENTDLNIKGAEFKFYKMKHPVETYGIRVSFNGKVFAYSSDTLYNENLLKLAKNADLFLCESTATVHDKAVTNIPHLSTVEAAGLARDANVKRLLLTHFWFENKREDYLREASSVFENTALSEEFKQYDI